MSVHRYKKQNNITKVFSFSLMQIVKNKVFIILTTICAILMFILTPTMIYMGEEVASSDTTSIKKVYIIDENGILYNTKALAKDGEKIKEFGDIKWYLVNEKFNVFKDEFEKKEENKSALLVQATVDKSSYLVNIYKMKDSDIKDKDVTNFSGDIVEFYNENKIKNIDLDTKSYNLVTTSVKTNTQIYSDDNNDHDTEATIIITLMMVIMFFLVLSGENIATQIVTEKSTKLVEYLLVNIRPVDLVCGKILASVVVSIIQMLAMVGSGLLSIVLCKKYGLINSYEDTLSLFNIKNIVEDVSVAEIILIVLFLIIGFLFYAILACMFSSTVSRLEDLSNATLLYGMVIIVVIYGLMFIVGFVDASDLVNNVLIALPFTSVFITPAFIMLGKLHMINYIISLIIQLVCIVLFGIFAAKIYMALIMYSGKKVTLKQVVNIFRKNKVGEIYE